jgi:hypothetical protein
VLRRRDLDEVRDDLAATLRAALIMLAVVDSKLDRVLYHLGANDEEDPDQ